MLHLIRSADRPFLHSLTIFAVALKLTNIGVCRWARHQTKTLAIQASVAETMGPPNPRAAQRKRSMEAVQANFRRRNKLFARMVLIASAARDLLSFNYTDTR
jgi:hypothetical protein